MSTDRPQAARVALVTTEHLARNGWQDPDTGPLRDALVRRGVDARVVYWYDEALDWGRFDLVVLRSPWDLFVLYPEHLVPWAVDVSQRSTVLNPPAVMRQVLDKRYLARLAAAGVPTVPTVFAEPGGPGGPFTVPPGEFVVKPVTSGGARATARYRPHESAAALAHVAYLHRRGETAMVQPYVPAIETLGEVNLVFFDGSYDHAVVKEPALRPGVPFDGAHPVHPGPRAHRPTPAELDVAYAALAAFAPAGPLLSARVDLLHDEHGEPMVLELELVTPALFLAHSPGAVDRYAQAIRRHLSPPATEPPPGSPGRGRAAEPMITP
ncbi:ATP-grasp domain-containing protein [Streptomyces omiyaensis]|uniref:RimK family alpha-L-glutamate ligase n=1 Tax=Streptomyces omiyaensis TaxID=68247 RepID=A0ABW7BUM0_9ACTN